TPDGCGSTDQVYPIPVTVKPGPVAVFAASSAGCVKDSVRLTDNSLMTSGAITHWIWNFGDGTSADLSSPAVTPKVYTAPATYTITLKVASDIGCVSLDAAQSIQQSAKPIAKFSYSAITCTDKDVVFTDASSFGAGTLTGWIWDLDDGKGSFTKPTNESQTTQYTTDGAKNAKLIVRTSTGCLSDPFTPQFSIKPQPKINFSLPEVCLSDAFALFTDSTTISDGSEAQFKWAWNLNSGSPAVTPGPSITTSTVKNPQTKYAKSDNYKVTLTVTSKDGCSATRTQDFTVNGSIPKAAFEIQNAPPYCGTKPVLLKNNSTVDFGNVTRVEIYWDLVNKPAVKEVDELPAPGKIYPHVYPDLQLPAGLPYTIKLVAYSGGVACSNGTTQVITVYPQPKADFTVSATQLCFGDVLIYTDKSKGVSSPATTWTWDLGKGDMSALQNPQKQYNDSGETNVSMYFYNADGCISDTMTKLLTIYPNPKLVLPHKITVLIEASVILKPVMVYGNELTYLWTPPTYLNSDTAATPRSIPTDDITYKLIVTGKGGCSVSDTIFIRVLKGPEVPNAFSPNGDGINDTWRIKYLDGYPGATLEVYNRYGQIVYRSSGYDVEWNGTYLGNPLPVGTYYYIINPKNGRKVISGSVTIIK
ncbi:MAG: domain containing protein, partial [Sediminibacterium sp.]|nr:domain containing protein [Sediminibacterium sp.]